MEVGPLLHFPSQVEIQNYLLNCPSLKEEQEIDKRVIEVFAQYFANRSCKPADLGLDMMTVIWDFEAKDPRQKKETISAIALLKLRRGLEDCAHSDVFKSKL